MSQRDFAAVKAAVQPDPNFEAGNQAVLFDVISAIGDHDIASLPRYFTEDSELHIHGVPGIDGSWRGRDTVIATISANFDKISEQKSQVESMIQHGDTIALLLAETGSFKADGRRYKSRGVLWFTFQGSQLHRIEEFLHTELAG